MHAGKWKVGELSELTHLSVRTLHYYEEIGLLVPSERTKAGHRQYTEADVERLQRILSLRQLGLSLGEIRDSLRSPDYSLATVIDLHLSKLTKHIVLQQRLHRRMSVLRAQLAEGETISAIEFLKTMGDIATIDQYLTSKQIEALDTLNEHHRSAHGTDAMQGFKSFVESLRGHLKASEDATSHSVQTLLKRQTDTSSSLLEDAQELGKALGQMLREQATLRQRYGLDDELMAYLEQALDFAQRQTELQ